MPVTRLNIFLNVWREKETPKNFILCWWGSADLQVFSQWVVNQIWKLKEKLFLHGIEYAQKRWPLLHSVMVGGSVQVGGAS